jgi:hypothetical protein
MENGRIRAYQALGEKDLEVFDASEGKVLFGEMKH